MQGNQGAQTGRYDLTGLKMIFFLIIGTYAAGFIMRLFSGAGMVRAVFGLLVIIAIFVIYYKALGSLKQYSDHFERMLPNLIGAVALLMVGTVLMYVFMLQYKWSMAMGAMAIFGMAAIVLGYRAIQEYLSGLASIPETAKDGLMYEKCLQLKKLWKIFLIAALIVIPVVVIVSGVMINSTNTGTGLFVLIGIPSVGCGIFGIVMTVLMLIYTWQIYSTYDGMPIGVPAGAAQAVKNPGEPGKAGEFFESLIHSASNGIHTATGSLRTKGAGAADQQRFCTMCGQPLGVDTRYCEYCGTKIEGRE